MTPPHLRHTLTRCTRRHVRLAKDFQNMDTSKDGRERLRIPVKLYSEKKRTQNRFNVRVLRMHITHPY